jgi:hypothetical protein
VRWGEPPVSNSRATHLTLPAHHAGPLPLPRERAERGTGSRLNRYRPNMWACPSRRPGREGSPRTAGPAGNFVRRRADVPICGATHLTSHASGVGPSLSPRKGGEGFSAGCCTSLLQFSSSRTRLGGGIAVFRRRYRCHLCVKIEVPDLSQNGRGGTSRRVIRCAAARPPALPAPSLRAAISLPAKTAGAAPVLLVKHLIRNGLWRCAGRFFGCVLDFSPCSQGGSSLSLDRSRGASGPRAGRFPGSPRGLPSGGPWAPCRLRAPLSSAPRTGTSSRPA